MKKLLVFLLLSPAISFGQMLKDPSTGKFMFSGDLKGVEVNSDTIFARANVLLSPPRFVTDSQNAAERSITCTEITSARYVADNGYQFRYKFTYRIHASIDNGTLYYNIDSLYFESDNQKISAESLWDQSQQMKEKKRKQISELFSHAKSKIDKTVNDLSLVVEGKPTISKENSKNDLARRVELLENAMLYNASQMSGHYREYSTGLFFSFLGIAGGAASALLIKNNGDTQTYGLIASGVISLLGTIMIIDSHKFFGRAGEIYMKPEGVTYRINLNN